MRSKPIIEDVLNKIRCPQFGYNDYGRWGILTFNQRLEIKELCDYAKSLEKCYEDYKSRCEKAIEHIKEHQLIYTNQYEEESNFDNHLLDILNGGDEE